MAGTLDDWFEGLDEAGLDWLDEIGEDGDFGDMLGALALRGAAAGYRRARDLVDELRFSDDELAELEAYERSVSDDMGTIEDRRATVRAKLFDNMSIADSAAFDDDFAKEVDDEIGPSTIAIEAELNPKFGKMVDKAIFGDD